MVLVVGLLLVLLLSDVGVVGGLVPVLCLALALALAVVCFFQCPFVWVVAAVGSPSCYFPCMCCSS